MPNPPVLERQLLHMDLRKGMNERVRPEAGDPANLLTKVENLQQDQDGSWVKRPGLTQLGTNAPSLPMRLLKTGKSAATVIYENGDIARYSEGGDSWSTVASPVARLPMFSAQADQIVSSGDRNDGAMVSHASTPKFHYVCYYQGSPGGYVVVKYDRESGGIVASYPLISVGPALNPSVRPPMLAVTSGENVHLVYHTTTGGNTSLWDFVNLDFTLPAITTSASAGPNIVDIAVSDNYCYVLTDISGTATVRQIDNAGALFKSQAIANAGQISASADKLWFATTANNIGARDLADVTVSAVASAASGTTLGFIVATADNYVYSLIASTPAFGGSTIDVLKVWRTTTQNGTTMGLQSGDIVGWKLQARPFAVTNDVFIHARKIDGTEGVSTQAVVNVTAGKSNVYTQGANSFYSRRVEAVVDPFVGTPNEGLAAYARRYFCRDGRNVSVALAQRTVQRGLAYTVVNLTRHDFHKYGQAQLGDQHFLAGGVQSNLGGKTREIGFVDMPAVNAADTGAAGSPNGAYKYVAVFRHVDETGSVAYSRTSSVASVTVASKNITVTISPPTVSNKDQYNDLVGSGTTTVEVYRTKSGGTVYYLVGTSQPDAVSPILNVSVSAAGYFTLTDTLSDSALGANALMYRQPGTPNGPVDRYTAPASNILVAHKDRLYTTGTTGAQVYYSSFFVDGESPWFNPVFGFFCHGGSGPITAIASMDGRLFVFKRDAVFVVDGDGPAEGGVAGNEFSPPQRLAMEYGCIDHRSVQVYAGGIFYRSARGIELLTRGLELRPVGDRVQLSADANPYTVGSCIDADGHYRILVAASAGAASFAGVSGLELVYDFMNDCWSRNSYATLPQDCVSVDLLGQDTVLYANPTAGVFKADTASWLDNGGYVSWTMETGWIRTGQQARQRLEKLLFLGKKVTNHRIKVEVAYNYKDDDYSDYTEWEPDSFNDAAIEELMKNTANNQALAVRFKITDNAPTDTTAYPVTTGRGCDILGLTVHMAAKGGYPRVAKEQRG